jgi:hypothetical protein
MEVVITVSNQVDTYRNARDARKNAENAGVKGRDLDTLKAAEAAAEATARAADPQGKLRTGFLD